MLFIDFGCKVFFQFGIINVRLLSTPRIIKPETIVITMNNYFCTESDAEIFQQCFEYPIAFQTNACKILRKKCNNVEEKTY